MTIFDERTSFYQWDTAQKVTDDNFAVGDEIHVTNSRQIEALTVIAYEFQGKVVADVPNILLQRAYPIIVYHYKNDGVSTYTCAEQSFEVKERQKPSDYVYEPNEVISYNYLKKKIEKLEAIVNSLISNGDNESGEGEIDNTIVGKIMRDRIPMLNGELQGGTVVLVETTYKYLEMAQTEADKQATENAFYQIVDNTGAVIESGYQVLTTSTSRAKYKFAIPEGAVISKTWNWNDATQTWIDYNPTFTKTGEQTTVNDVVYDIYESSSSSSGGQLRIVLE